MRPLAADSFPTGVSNPASPPAARNAAVRFTFADEGLLEEAQRTLELARIATESLFGAAAVTLDADCQLDPAARSIVIDASSGVGRTLAAVYHGYVLAEFGSDAVTVERRPYGAARPGEAR